MKNIDSLSSKPKQEITGTINLASFQKQKKPKKILKIILITILVSILWVGGLGILRIFNISDKIFVGKKLSFFQKISSFFQNSKIKLIGEDLSQINILLLGIGGEGHEGPNLTDTMILAQIRPDSGQIAFSSIPRDYLVKLPEKYGLQKINSAFAYGLSKNNDFGEAGLWATKVTEEISGLNIPYFIEIDFAGFQKAIDEIGGIELTVDREFTDSEFPNESYGFLPNLTFHKGFQTMNGKTALQFARSRHGNNDEGSDFARSQRQQKVISAFRNKLLSLNLIKNISGINKLLSILADHFHTNLQPKELLHLYSLVKEKNIKDFLSANLGPETNLICDSRQEETGAYVVVPCFGKTEENIKNYFKNAFIIGKLTKEKTIIWLATSTTNQKEFQKVFSDLQTTGFIVWELNYSKDALEKNIIYQANQKPASAEYIKNILNAVEVTIPPPEVKIDKNKVDIIVILGKNS
jgi:LCP family protein required for cell wall assembly